MLLTDLLVYLPEENQHRVSEFRHEGSFIVFSDSHNPYTYLCMYYCFLHSR